MLRFQPKENVWSRGQKATKRWRFRRCPSLSTSAQWKLRTAVAMEPHKWIEYAEYILQSNLWLANMNLLLPGLVVSDPLGSSWLDLLHELTAEHRAVSFLFVQLHAKVWTPICLLHLHMYYIWSTVLLYPHAAKHKNILINMTLVKHTFLFHAGGNGA